MPDIKKKPAQPRTPKRYAPPQADGPPEYSVEIACPLCGRRVCDLSGHPQESLWVGLKCPHCHNIVHLQCEMPGMTDTS